MIEMKHEWKAVQDALEEIGLDQDPDHVKEYEWSECALETAPVLTIWGTWVRVTPVYSRRDIPPMSPTAMGIHIGMLLTGHPSPVKDVLRGPDVGKLIAGGALRVVHLYDLLRLRRISLSFQLEHTHRGITLRVELEPFNRGKFAHNFQAPLDLLEQGLPLDDHLDAFMFDCIRGLVRGSA